MRKFTAKKIVRKRQEFETLMSDLKKDGYTWASGQDLITGYDTIYLREHIPVLLAFDAKYKDVYYSTHIDAVLSVDPNYR